MLRKSVKTSLTVRIFCVTTLILFAASAVTFGIIALATPISYTAVVSDRLTARSANLAAALEDVSMESSGPLLDQFILENSASVTVIGPDGNLLQTPSTLAVSTVEDGGVVVITSHAAESTPLRKGSADTEDSVSVAEDTTVTVTENFFDADGTDTLLYEFTFQDWADPCTLHITPRAERVNPSVQALGRVAPWLLGAMLLFSLLCSVFYSRYITRPIVRLSRISKRLAELDFDWVCGETRQDEIGVLGQSLDALSQRLSASLGELRAANAALQRDIDRERELERQRLTFFSAASHELKTPVTILKGQLTGMLEGVDVYRDRDTYLARSLAVTRRMESLIQEILAVSRMEQADFSLHLEPVDLGELVAGQAELLADLATQRKQRFAVRPASGILFPGDRALLERAVSNLLSNAILYSPEGASITAQLSPSSAGAVLFVENSGVHIPEDALPHLFEAFYRVDASRNRSTGGSGLGLYLVRMILDRHGAETHVENTANGVRFTIAFPAADAHIPAQKRTSL